ncbi:MAG: DinB family protein [Segetibacter sp.]
MNINDLKMLRAFNHTIDIWINELEQYDFLQLGAKPSPKSWSLGQVYMHLIDDTTYYIEQIKICVSTNDNVIEEASPGAKTMFLNNDFPDEIIEGAPANFYIRQPDNKEQLMRCLMNLKDEINNVEILISKSPFKGKTKHPGLNYFNANESFRFAEMHFRHHLRQKKRIDDFLKINS